MKTGEANLAVEMTGRGKEENQQQVFLLFHRPWKSLRDSHIPTASTTILLSFELKPKERNPAHHLSPSGSSFNENMLPYIPFSSIESPQHLQRMTQMGGA
jgi:hypothetical protein